MERLRQRADFLAAAKGAKAPAAAFVVQARKRADDGTVRIGFTVSRKVGGAVERNRVKRRLRALTRECPDGLLRAGHDYVLIGRRTALSMPFARLIDDFTGALRRLHAERRSGSPPRSAAPARSEIDQS